MAPSQPLFYIPRREHRPVHTPPQFQHFSRTVLPPTGTVTVTSTPAGVSGTAPLTAAVDPAAQGGTQAPGSWQTSPFLQEQPSTYNVTSLTAAIPTIRRHLSQRLNSIRKLQQRRNSELHNHRNHRGTVLSKCGPEGHRHCDRHHGHPAPTQKSSSTPPGTISSNISFSPNPATSRHSPFRSTVHTSSGSKLQITLQYTGDNTYAPSAFTLNSAAITNPLSDFTLVPSTSNVPVTAGSNGTTAINLASVNGFTGTVNSDLHRSFRRYLRHFPPRRR